MSLKKFLSDLSAKKFDSLTPEEITSLYNAEKQERANKVNPRSDKQKLALIKDDWRRLKKQVKKDGQIVDVKKVVELNGIYQGSLKFKSHIKGCIERMANKYYSQNKNSSFPFAPAEYLPNLPHLILCQGEVFFEC